jgi:hypothetical protein
MTGFTDRTAQGILNHIVGKAALYAMPQAFVALYTGVGNDGGVGFTEPAGGGYQRAATAAADWNSASGSSPSIITNANPVVYPTAPTGNWGTVFAFGIHDALTAGNANAWDYLGNFPWKPVEISAANPAVFTSHAHGYLAGDNVVFSVEYGGANPAFSASNLLGLLVVAAPVTADTFTVTNAGTPVATTGGGDGMIRKVVAQPIPSGASAPAFAAGALTISGS